MLATAARYGIRVKYHKATDIIKYGAPYLQLAWVYTAEEPAPGVNLHSRRQVSKHQSGRGILVMTSSA